MKVIFRLLLIGACFFSFGYAQVGNQYTVALNPKNISGFGGLQSFVAAQHNGLWLLIGGRKDGLHRRQPFASFDIANHNTDIWVIDPTTRQTWTASVNILSASLKEQLQSTNMQFIQRQNQLYIVGGYGYSYVKADHTTFPYLTAVNVAGLISDIQNNQSIAANFRQISDTLFAQTGGQLGYLDSTYYLVGGHNFEGRYNPMNGPSFVQKYSNQIRMFTIQDDGTILGFQLQNVVTDENLLHRRDYNLLPQIFPGNIKGFTLFSGVFQKNADLPYLDCINITPTQHAVAPGFLQYYNHYHCAKVALYSATTQKMENLFFGGISQYYDSMGVRVQNNNVPFVKTIANVARGANNQMTETVIGQMPGYLGAGAEFLLNHDMAHDAQEIVYTDSLSGDSVLIGHIIGGINSTQRDIFFINTGMESGASSSIYEVWLVKNASGIGGNLPKTSTNLSHLKVSPNPSEGEIVVSYTLQKSSIVTLRIYDEGGVLQWQNGSGERSIGENSHRIKLSAVPGIYFLSANDGVEIKVKKFVIK